jgi:ribonuclease HI
LSVESYAPRQIITFLSLLSAQSFHQSLFEVFIDGASRGNPGLAGVGVVLYDGNRRILSYREFIGEKTNNQAEYHSLKRGLQIAILICARINVLSDSNLLVNQRLRKYKIRNMNLKSISREVSNLEKVFQEVKYKYISREENMQADREANNAIDDYIKYQKPNSLLGSGEDSELDQYK